MVAPEHRRHMRFSVRFPGEISFDWGCLTGVIENIGEGGAFFVTDTLEGAVADGDRLEVNYRTDEDLPPESRCGSVLRVDRYFHEGEVVRSFAILFDREDGPDVGSSH